MSIIDENDTLNQGRVKLNNAFENLGAYLPKGSVTPEKTSFVRAEKNIFNKNDIVPGRITNSGTIIEHAGVYTAGYEMIEPDRVYITNKSIWQAQFDSDFNIVAWAFIEANNTFTTQSNAYYVRISTQDTNLETLQVEKGNVTTEYEPYRRTLVDVQFKEIADASKSDIKHKQFASIKERLDEIEQDVASLEPPDQDIVDDEVAIQVFVEEMNKKAELIGCDNLNFKNSSGLSASGQLTSPKDFTLITRHASGIPALQKVWGAKNYVVHVKGPNARNVSITTTVQDTTFEQDYLILGGKTGTLGIVRNLCIVAKHKATGHILAGTILRADNDRWLAMKQLLDGAVDIIENDASPPTVDSIGACATLLPNNPLLYSNAPLDELVLQGNTSLQSPASIVKILTSIVMIENVLNLTESFTYKASDDSEDTLNFDEGDRVTFRDALYLMMLQSNNTTAKAVARAVGQRIVRERGYA